RDALHRGLASRRSGAASAHGRIRYAIPEWLARRGDSPPGRRGGADHSHPRPRAFDVPHGHARLLRARARAACAIPGDRRATPARLARAALHALSSLQSAAGWGREGSDRGPSAGRHRGYVRTLLDLRGMPARLLAGQPLGADAQPAARDAGIGFRVDESGSRRRRSERKSSLTLLFGKSSLTLLFGKSSLTLLFVVEETYTHTCVSFPECSPILRYSLIH